MIVLIELGGCLIRRGCDKNKENYYIKALLICIVMIIDKLRCIFIVSLLLNRFKRLVRTHVSCVLPGPLPTPKHLGHHCG